MVPAVGDIVGAMLVTAATITNMLSPIKLRFHNRNSIMFISNPLSGMANPCPLTAANPPDRGTGRRTGSPDQLDGPGSRTGGGGGTGGGAGTAGGSGTLPTAAHAAAVLQAPGRDERIRRGRRIRQDRRIIQYRKVRRDGEDQAG